MEFDLSDVNYSNKDLKRSVTIPNTLTSDLAEDLGIHIGDGSLYRSGRYRTLEFYYSAHILEREYINHIMNLKKRLYNLNNFKIRVKDNELGLRFWSMAVAIFFNKVLCMPIGKKSRTVDVPDFIKNSDDVEILSSFLRGIIDTDFSLTFKKKGKAHHTYPVLNAHFASPFLVQSLVSLFQKLDFKSYHKLNSNIFDSRTNKTYSRNTIEINGKRQFMRYIELIGSNNPKNKAKCLTWKETGYCNPSNGPRQI